MTPVTDALTIDHLVRENETLRARLEEAEDALRALRAGEVDAVLVETDHEQIYTLETHDKPYRLLVEQMPQGAATFALDGTILFCNACFASLLQRPAHDLRGRNLHDLVAPGSGAALTAMLSDAQAGSVQGEIVLMRGDGTAAPVYLGVSALSEGALGQCLIVIDLTDKRHYEELQRAQLALRTSEDRYRSLFESIDEGFCVIEILFDAAGRPNDFRFLETNPSFEQQSGLRDVVGKTMRELAPAHEEHWFRTFGHVAATGEPIRFQNRADALHRWYDVYAFRAGEAHECKVAVLFTDITVRKQTEEALRDADRKKDEFLATLAHELRNPLAPIRNAVQLLRAKGPPVPELVWARGVIDRQVQLMARLLEDLLDVSRISRNKLQLRQENVDLRQVIDAALETSRPPIEAGAHQLTVTLPAEPVRLSGDTVRLAQVFANLLNNAAKFTEPGGRIRVAAERQGSDAVVSVRDNGIGIAPAMLSRIFEIYSQEEPTLVRSQDGLGIGLSLVKGLVELHGGSVEARSEGPGRGSEFIVRLPVLLTPPVREPDQVGDDSQHHSGCKHRILIVDDNRDSADSLARLLMLMGHEVSTAYDGQQALQEAEALRPEIMLLDIGMPKLNGYDACARIREQPWGRDIYLVAVTGWGQEEDRRRTEKVGFNEHMVKPVDPDALLKLLASLPAMQPSS